MARMARVLGDAVNQRKFSEWHASSAKAFHSRFYRADRASYGSQTADSMALSFGIVPEDLRARVAESLKNDVLVAWKGHASVGALGHRWLYPSLSDAGHADAALGTFHAEGHPGFSYLFDELHGTTLWERKGAFDPATMEAPVRSLSHPFHGGFDAWFYSGLGGIRPDPDNPGFKHFFLRAEFPRGLDRVEVEFECGYGLIASAWRRDDGRIIWDVTVPPNTAATVDIPARSIANAKVNGRPADAHAAAGSSARHPPGHLLRLRPGAWAIDLDDRPARHPRGLPQR
jgi:alpha-L-rhamnosidase